MNLVPSRESAQPQPCLYIGVLHRPDLNVKTFALHPFFLLRCPPYSLLARRLHASLRPRALFCGISCHGMIPAALPHSILDVRQLDELLSDPADYVVDTMRNLDGNLLVLGVAGKMGPTLAMMAKHASTRAGVHRRIIGVARFSDLSQQERSRRQASRLFVAISLMRTRSSACPTRRTSSSWPGASLDRPASSR